MKIVQYLTNLLLVVAVVLSPISVWAQSGGGLEGYYRRQGIDYYDPGGACSNGSTGASTSTDGNTLSSAVQLNAYQGEQITPKAIILHWTAFEYGNNPNRLVDVLRSQTQPTGGTEYPAGRWVQLTISRSGTVYQLTNTLETRPMQSVEDQEWNDVSIGIEIESVTTNSTSVAAADLMGNTTQYRKVREVVRQLMKKYNIKNEADLANKKGVFGHYEAWDQKSDPGRDYMQKIRFDLNSANNEDDSIIQSTTVAVGCACRVGGSNNVEIVMNFFMSKGLSSAQAAGITGNFQFESADQNIDTRAINSSSGATGIAQWLGGRKDQLFVFAEKTGRDVFDLQLQLDYVWLELTGEPPTPGVSPNDESASLRDIQTKDDPQAAALSWEAKYERSGGEGLKERTDNAQKVFDTYGQGGYVSNGCASVNAAGYAFPLQGEKREFRAFTSLPCTVGPNGCHHDDTPAFDLIVGGGRDDTKGRKVFAIHDGTVRVVPAYDGIAYCYSIHLTQNNSENPNDDGWDYWYGHITDPVVSTGQQVEAGQELAVVGPTECAKNTITHLHIDRGFPKGVGGGRDSSRDPGFIDLLNAIYEGLPG